ncbi:hypothetical protein DL96DRAFT_1417365, partial [Flagelloscypha sp. PMI_526]
ENGGLLAGSILEILKEMMNRFGVDVCAATDNEMIEDIRPCQVFDLIGGSGTGGIIAILIGRLGLSVAEAFKSYAEFSQEVFEEGLSREVLSSRFEIAAKKLVAKHTTSEDTKMCSPGNKIGCKTFVLASSPDKADSVEYFRTYRSRSNDGRNCAIWEAMMATTANRGLYLDLEITDSYGVSARYCGTELGNNNPTKQLLEETKLQFRDWRLLSVISIGSGYPRTIVLPENAESINGILQAIFQDCEKDADEMDAKFGLEKTIRGFNPYWRFCEDRGMEDPIALEDETSAVGGTRRYLQKWKVSHRLNKVVERL